MRNYFLLIFIFLLFSCDNNKDSNEANNKKTTMTISNLNFIGYIEVTYASVDFGFYRNIGTGKVTKEVQSGTYNIFITDHVFYDDDDYRDFFAGSNMQNHKLSCICPVFRTNTVVSEEGQDNQFNITKNTVITFISGYGYNSAEEIIGPLQDVSDNVTVKYFEYLRDKKLEENEEPKPKYILGGGLPGLYAQWWVTQEGANLYTGINAIPNLEFKDNSEFSILTSIGFFSATETVITRLAEDTVNESYYPIGTARYIINGTKLTISDVTYNCMPEGEFYKKE